MKHPTDMPSLHNLQAEKAVDGLPTHRNGGILTRQRGVGRRAEKSITPDLPALPSGVYAARTSRMEQV